MRIALAAAFLLTMPLGAQAQAPNAPDDFGTQDEAITIISFFDFRPSPTNERYWYTGMNMLPNGALLTQVVFYFLDNDPVGDFTGTLGYSHVRSDTGGSLDLHTVVSLHSSGTPGSSQLNDFPNLPIIYRQDVDGDGNSDVVNYFLWVDLPPLADVALAMVRLRWRRQVSPAPQTATFNDVPTSDPAFQFIEALAASGITVGCSTNPPLYCPGAGLTRRQMAVFLSKALGLHWPWNAQ